MSVHFTGQQRIQKEIGGIHTAIESWIVELVSRGVVGGLGRVCGFCVSQLFFDIDYGRTMMLVDWILQAMAGGKEVPLR